MEISLHVVIYNSIAMTEAHKPREKNDFLLEGSINEPNDKNDAYSGDYC